MTAGIFVPESDGEIEACYPVFAALRPHVRQEDFLRRVRRQQEQSYRIVALRHEGSIVSAAGFRSADFLAWGKVLYIDDLTTLPEARGKGFAAALLDWLPGHGLRRRAPGYGLRASRRAPAVSQPRVRARLPPHGQGPAQAAPMTAGTVAAGSRPE